MYPNTTKRWAVIGGGILGMQLANKLAKQGQEVTLFEAAESLGGLTSAWQLKNVLWDKYYHVTLLSDTYLRDLLKELKLDAETNWVETKTGFYTNGKLHSMSNSFEFLSFPPLSLIDKFRLGATIFYASKVKNWRKLEGMHVADWLKKLSGKNTFEKIWLPLLRAKLGEHYQHTAASFIWATIQRMYAARRTGLKKEMFGYVAGGYARVLQSFYAHLVDQGVDVHTSHRAQAIEPLEQGGVQVKFQNGHVDTFDEVILTLPAHIAGKICQGLSQEEYRQLNKIQYLGVVCASLLLKKPISPYYVTNITDPSPFTGIIEMTTLVDKAYFGGKSLIYLPKYIKADDPFFRLTDEEIREQFWNKLLDMYPELEPDDLISFHVARAPNVFALTTLDYSQDLPPVSTSAPGIHILNSAHIVNGTLNVNESLQLAEKQLPGIMERAYQHTSKEKIYG